MEPGEESKPFGLFSIQPKGPHSLFKESIDTGRPSEREISGYAGTAVVSVNFRGCQEWQGGEEGRRRVGE